MGKGNMLLGRLRKSVGDLTFRVSEGEQIVSAKAKTVRNPKTMNQRVQRAIFSTASQLASSLYSLVNHSFEGETRTNGSLRAFRKAAIADLRKFYEDGDGSLCLNPKNTMNPEPNQVLVSKGRLGALDVEYYSTGAGQFRVGGSVAGMNDPHAVTFAQLKNALGIDVKGGDEIAIVTMISRRGIISAQLNRVVLVDNIADTDDVLNSHENTTLGFSPFAIQADKTVANINTMLQESNVDASNGALEVVIDAANTTLVAAAVVVSHYDTERGMWIYTTSRMGVDANFFASYDNDAAIASYGDAAAAAPTSDYFLDQSTRTVEPVADSLTAWLRAVATDNYNTDLMEIVSGGDEITVTYPSSKTLTNIKVNVEVPQNIGTPTGTAKFKKLQFLLEIDGEFVPVKELTKYADIGLFNVEIPSELAEKPSFYLQVRGFFHQTGVTEDYEIAADGIFAKQA